MVAAPQYATFTISNGRRTNSIDAYLSDVADARINLDSGQGASSSSETDYFAKISGYIVDFSIATGMTDTTKIQILINNTPTGDHLRFANHVNTLNNRIPLRIPILAGQRIAAIQRA